MKPRVDYPFEFALPGAEVEASPLGEIRPETDSGPEPTDPNRPGDAPAIGSENGT